MSKGTAGIFDVGRTIWEALRSGLAVSTHATVRTSPSQGRGAPHALSPAGAIAALPARRCGARKLLSAAGGRAGRKRDDSQGQGRRPAGASPEVTAL